MIVMCHKCIRVGFTFLQQCNDVEYPLVSVHRVQSEQKGSCKIPAEFFLTFMHAQRGEK